MPLESRREKALVVGVVSRSASRALVEEHLDELARLVDSAGGEVVGRFVKERPAPDPATYIGRGSVEEIGNAARADAADLVVFDDELSPAQARNLEERWKGSVRVLDRPGLILDVFASHARTREASIQVELAQLQYLLPRLAGRYAHLSRLGGGIGARGAGEQKLELDRRKIRTRIARLRRDLAKIETARGVRRRGRQGSFQIAIAGYTNAGKTTLFNRLTRESAYAANRLFATLDSRAARARAPALRRVLLVDTVGFVRKLPTSLVASFRSTLAEIREADLVLHVLDAASPRVEEEWRVASEMLEQLGVPAEKIVPVWTKTDLAAAPPGALAVSATTGDGIDRLEAEIARRARPEPEQFRLRIPYTRGRAIAAARAAFRVIGEEDLGDALSLTLAGERRNLHPFLTFLERGAQERKGEPFGSPP